MPSVSSDIQTQREIEKTWGGRVFLTNFESICKEDETNTQGVV